MAHSHDMLFRTTPDGRRDGTGRSGFTILEILLATVLMSIMMVVVFLSFNAVSTAWRKSSELADKLQHSDYALSQVISGLRSAYYPTTGSKSGEYGFMLMDNGDGPEAADRIRWTKLGTAIVGGSSSLAQTPHTVEIWTEQPSGDMPGGLMARAWRGELQTDDFDPDDEEQVKPYMLVDGIQGFNCRVLDESQPFKNDGTPNWQDHWNASNTLPRAVELTFTLAPTEKGDTPAEIRRYVNIPLWDISQNPVAAGSDNGKNARRPGSGGTGTGTGTGTGAGSGGRNGGGASGRNVPGGRNVAPGGGTVAPGGGRPVQGQPPPPL